MASREETDGFSAEERTAMQDRAKELKVPRATKLTGEADMFDKVSAMTPDEQEMAFRLHSLITENVPHLVAKTWYGMPAWSQGGKVICFFQAASTFKTRYSTLGFDEHAQLDEGYWWPTAFALVRLTPEIEKHVIALITKAAPA